MFEDLESKKEQFDIAVGQLQEKDIADLEFILREYVRDRSTGEIVESEIDEIKGYMQGKEEIIDKETQESRKRIYFVAKDKEGKAIGCMAYSDPEPQMIKHFEGVLKMNSQEVKEKCVEILNAFVSRELSGGKGVGRKLFDAICDAARDSKKEYAVVNSGQRYKKSWEFYDKVGAQRQGLILDKYGKGGDAMTWVKKL